MKYLLLAALAVAANAAIAANPKFDCTSSCLFVADPYPSTGPVPSVCKLYSSGSLKASAAAVAISGGMQCQIRAQFAQGSYSVTMSAVDSAGQETAQSLPFAFDSAATLQAPVNVHIQ